MDTVLLLLHIRGLKPLLVIYFRVEEKFAGGKFRGWKILRNSVRSGYYFRGRKISRKIKIRENSEHFLHAKNWCYTVLLIKKCRFFNRPFFCFRRNNKSFQSLIHMSTLSCRVIREMSFFMYHYTATDIHI